MRGVYRAADIEVDVRGLFKKQARDLRSAVFFITPLRVGLIVGQIVPVRI